MDYIQKQINRFIEIIKSKTKNNLLESKIAKNKENNKNIRIKKIESLVIYIVIFSITIVAIKYIFSSNKNANLNTKIKNQTNNIDTELVKDGSGFEDIKMEKTELESSLKNILSNLKGVGNVEVMVTYSQTSKTVPIYNENEKRNKTEETDSSGGTRKIESIDVSKEVVSDSSSSIATEKIILPKIEGAIIIAEGAGDSNIKNNIISAVEAVLRA